jgi:hypothetical protein
MDPTDCIHCNGKLNLNDQQLLKSPFCTKCLEKIQHNINIETENELKFTKIYNTMSASLFAVTIRSYIEKRDLFTVTLRNIATGQTVGVLINKENPLHKSLYTIYIQNCKSDSINELLNKEISVNKLLFEGEIQTIIIGEAFL